MLSEKDNERNYFFDMKLKYCCIFLLLFLSYTIKASNESDTLQIAKSLIQKGKFKKAEKILAAYERSHPQDLNAMWLHGQTAYWAGYYRTFNLVYKKAMARFPSNYYLKLDYALKLVENGDVKQAAPLLEAYSKYDPSSNDLKLVQARIAYWQGDYKRALQLLKNESLVKEKQQETEILHAEIKAAQSPWLKINADYLQDDQPLQVITPALEAGTYLNAFVNPSISLSNGSFKTDTTSSSAQRISIGNKFNFYKAGLVVVANAGFAKLPNKARTGIGGIELTKTSFKYLQLSGQASLQPYLVTLSSISETIVPYHFALGAGWNNLNSWNGKLAWSMDTFKDKNYIYNVSAWIFAPPLRLASLQFRIGYAYGYSTSKENRYVAKQSVTEIVKVYGKTTTITGVYDPYFTPTNQQVNAALVSISYSKGKRFVGGVNASIGFIGYTDDPYLFLDKNKSNEVYVNRDYSHINFYPNRVDAYILCKITKKASLKASYSFLNNNFYTCHTAGLSLLMNFWNEENRK